VFSDLLLLRRRSHSGNIVLQTDQAMKRLALAVLSLPVFVACVSETPRDPLDDYVEVKPATILEAPSAIRDGIRRGEYMVELLGCGACHTNGALQGAPDWDRPLAGSDVGIAMTTPLEYRNPAILYAPNLTPDVKTGLGSWSEEQIVDAIRAGKDRHGGSLGLVMPWRGYGILSDEDARAIAGYLLSLDPVEHQVPRNVPQGQKARGPFVYFGVYEKK
jgi:mono/diheme cytochrome c family protein